VTGDPEQAEEPGEEVARRYAFNLKADQPVSMRVELPGPCPGCGEHRLTADLVRGEDNNDLTIWFSWEQAPPREDNPTPGSRALE
jgi:hypothetical protein